jgi:hypothetical protein
MNGSAQRKTLPQRLFDGRFEKRERRLVPVYLASLKDPLAGERTITANVSPPGARMFTKRRWLPGEQPLITPLTGEFPKHAQVIYCDPQPNGGFSMGIEFSGPPFEWGVLPRE